MRANYFVLTSLPTPSRFFLIQYAMKLQSEDWLQQANCSVSGLEFDRMENETGFSASKGPLRFFFFFFFFLQHVCPEDAWVRRKEQSRNGCPQVLNPSPSLDLGPGLLSFVMLLPSNLPAICFMNVMQTPSAPRTPLFTSSRTNHTN